MKVHSTNYFNSFIEIVMSSDVGKAEIPFFNGEDKTIAYMQFELISQFPYKYTSDELLFHIFAVRNSIDENEIEESKLNFFSKGQPCLRCSPLAKRYGWGIHFNEVGKVAIYAVDSEEYKKYKNDNNLQHIKAMNSKKRK